MRKLLIGLYLVISFTSFCQTEENWDAYMASYEKGPGSTLLNMSLKQIAPVKTLPFVIVTGVTFKDCTNEGMPTKAEFENLYKISDSIKNLLDKNYTNTLAGTFTYQCQRLDYYFSSDTVKIRSSLKLVYENRFPGYEYYINIKSDPEWRFYLDFLYPNKESQEYMSNQKVISKLQQEGDQLIKARQVDHWLYFKTEKDREKFIEYAKEKGFKIENKRFPKDSKLYQLQISRNDKVDIDSISSITLELRKKAESFNGDYDGWETFVIKD
ncbi:MAG: DUF695 domain-containing protein [Bacteroidota bacterium]